MNIVKVNGTNKDFFKLCENLEEFQFNLIPVLKEKGYNLTENLNDIVGFVLYIDNLPIGSIGLKKIDESTCEIVRVFIREDYRGNGYAKLLFEKIENLAKTMGFKKAEMVAWCKAKSALRLYKKLNFTFSEEKESKWFAELRYVELFKNL